MDPGYVGPYGFIIFRGISGCILFWTAAQFFPSEKVERKDFRLLLTCSVFGVAINQSFFFAGLHLTTPIHASLMSIMTPLIVLPLSAYMVKEAITTRKIAGIFCGVLGAMILITYGKELSASSTSRIGDLFIIINAVSYGIYLVLVKRLTTKYHAITISKYVFLFGLFLVLPFGWKEAMAVQWSAFDLHIALCFAYVLIFTTFFAYLLNAFALQWVQTSVVSIYIYLQPILATGLALFLGKDQLNWVQVISAALIFYGVFLVSFRRQKSL